MVAWYRGREMNRLIRSEMSMSKDAVTVSTEPDRNRYETILDLYVVAMSIVIMLFGLRHWAVIVGLLSSPGGSFEAMITPWKILTMHMGVMSLVAAVGLWMRSAWGKVVWVYAAMVEIVVHVIFAGTFGNDWPLVIFHVLSVGIFILLTILAAQSRHQA